MPTFDVTSQLNLQEVRNAVDQTAREIDQRYDFKGSNSIIELKENSINMATTSEDRLKALRTVLEEKLVKRKVSLKAFDYNKIEPASGGTVRQEIALKTGINSDKAREINKFIKELGIKGIQAQIQGEQIRVSGKKRDHLQSIIAALKERDFNLPLQFVNFRD